MYCVQIQLNGMDAATCLGNLLILSRDGNSSSSSGLSSGAVRKYASFLPDSTSRPDGSLAKTGTMTTDGSVMRLGKEDFKRLLNEPMLDWVEMQQAEEIIKNGGKWLDVRLPSEFENQHLDGAINIPLYFIRLKINTLDEDMDYVLCCDTGRRSSAGAYILSERGFKAHVLKDGIHAAQA